MQYISGENLTAFKQMMSIYHSHEDAYLEYLLESSYLFLKNKCGEFSVEGINAGTELMYQRARYAYHDSLEYFDENFMSMVYNFALQNLPENEVTEDANTSEQNLS